jgi:hypothetical protein
MRNACSDAAAILIWLKKACQNKASALFLASGN